MHDEKELDAFVPYVHIDWYKEGVMPWTVKKFKLGYSYKYKRNVIPLRYWLTGELMGYNMRTTVENYDLFDIKNITLHQDIQNRLICMVYMRIESRLKNQIMLWL